MAASIPQPSSASQLPSAGARGAWLAVAVLVLVPLAVFGRVVTGELVAWDDLWHLPENPYLNPLSWQQLLRVWREPYFGEYVPMLYTYFAGGIVINDLRSSSGGSFDAGVFHAGSLLLHVACGLLVFRLLRRLFANTLAACCGALVFLLHPLATEPVAWVSEARGLLAVFFGLLAIWHYFQACEFGTVGAHPIVRSRAWRGVHYALATCCFALALVSKPSAVALPLVMLVLDWGFLRRGWRSMAGSLGLWFAMAALLTYVTKQQQQNETIRELTALWQRTLVSADALAFYFYKFAVPLSLTPDYGRMPSVAFAHGWPYWTWIVPLVVVVGLWWLGNRTLWTAAGIFVAGVLPVLGLVPFAFQDISTVADRYVYLSLLGPAIACAWLIARFPSPPLLAGLALLLCVWSVLDWRQVERWHDSKTLFEYALSVNPRSLPMFNNMIVTLRNERRPVDALPWASRALEARPERDQPYLNLGTLLQDLNRLDEAANVLQKGIAVDPRSMSLRRGLAQVLSKHGRPAEAREQYVQMLEIEPTNALAKLGLAKTALELNDLAAAEQICADLSEHPPEEADLRVVLGDLALQLGHHDLARRHYEAALAGPVQPGDIWFKIGLLEQQRQAPAAARDAFRQALAQGKTGPDAHRELAGVLLALGETGPAVDAYRAVLALDANDRAALNNAAWLMANDATGKIANGPEAVKLAERLCQLDQPPSPSALDTLAAAYAKANRFEDAVRTATRAIDAAQTANNVPLVEEIRGHLRRFESGQPLP